MRQPCYLAAHCVVRRLSGKSQMTLSPKRRGELAELMFALKAATMGLVVSKPWGDSFPYDVVVESNHRMLRIQVKASFLSTRAGYCINIAARGQHGGHRSYSPDEVDFIVAYVVRYDAWYIIPTAALGDLKHIRLYPGGSRKRNTGQFEQFREAWALLIGNLPSPIPDE